MIEWKKPTEEVHKLLRAAFYNDILRPDDITREGITTITKEQLPDPFADFVWATDWEIAKGLGRDLSNLDKNEQKSPLYYDWWGGYGEDFEKHVLPPPIREKFFIATLANGAEIVIIDAKVEGYNVKSEPN